MVTKRWLGRCGEALVERHALVIVGEPVERATFGTGPDYRSARFVIEVKTVLAGTEAKIKSAARAIRLKRATAAALGKQAMSILVVVSPPLRRATVYRRLGFRAYRVGSMRRVGAFDVEGL